MDPLLLIIRTIGEMFAFIAILRFLLQTMKVDYYNPISQAVVKITQPPLMPLQRSLPRIAGIDVSPLVLAFLVKLGTLFLLVSMTASTLGFGPIAVFSLVGVLDTLLTILFWATIGSVIISWVAPNSPHPAPQLLVQLVEPLFALVRRVIPPIGGLDLSPIAIFLVIQIIQSQLPRLM